MRLPTICAAGALLLFAGCGGSGGDSAFTMPPPPGAKNASPGGIWQGTESPAGLQITGLVDESGEAHFIRSDGVQYVGTGTTTGNQVSGHFEAFTPFGKVFPDGSTHGTGSISGTIQERSSLTADSSFTTDGGTVYTGSADLTYNSAYETPSSLSAIAGNYTDTSTGDTVTVDGTGAIFAQDPASGCVLSGSVSIIDARFNAYRVHVAYANCTGASVALNGVSFDGLATVAPGSPQQIVAGLTGEAASVKYAVVYVLNKD